ncbi:MAG: ABC transporter ATP-binding protein, partial [Oscillospiraceae bacterium]|nr:ABC transporter ATP-binding protein [Oscillospiraceae bacterium]
NDVDYQVARSLAAEVITEQPFMPISDAAFNRALELMKTCDTVICTGVPMGETNRRMAELIQEARSLGLLRDGEEGTEET